MTPRYRILPIPIGSGGPSGNYATNISVTMDENYVLSVQLIDQDGNALGNEQTIDLPVESCVVNGRYDAQTQSLVLVLDNGNEISIPVSGLISGLRETIELTDMTQAELVDFYTNYETLIGQNTYVLNGYAFSIGTMDQQGATLLVLEYNSVFGSNATDPTVPVDTISVSQKTYLLLPNGTLQDYSASGMIVPTTNYLSTVAHTGSYNDLTDKPAGGQSFYMSQEEYDALVDPQDGDYHIQGPVQYQEIEGTPNLDLYASKNITEKKLAELEAAQKGYEIVYLTQQEYDTLTNKLEGVMYVITGNTITMEVTFTDQTTATYNVVVD